MGTHSKSTTSSISTLMMSCSQRSSCLKTQKSGLCPHLDSFAVDDNFFPAVSAASVSCERGFSESQVAEALEKLRRTLTILEECLEGRKYLAGEFSLADVAHTGNFVRLRELAEEGEVSLSG